MAPQRAVEFAQAARGVGVLRRAHFGQHVGMAADRALAEDDQAARENVGAFHRDADRQLLVGAAQEVRRTQADALAADDIHAVVDHLAGAFGDVVFDDGRCHGGLFAQVHGAGRHDARRVHQVGVAADARQRLLHAFESAHRHAELAAHPRIGAHGARGQLGHACVGRRQRDRAARRQAFHQHAPALAGHGRPADDEFQRHEYVRAAGGAVHEHRVERKMAPAGVDAGMIVRHQCAGDAEILAPAQQAVRVVQAKRQPQQRADGRQRDVALVPGDAHAQDFLALPLALADRAVVGNGGRVRAGPRAGEREGRYFLAARQARQVVALLRLGAVVQQQFGRP
ncbi:Uncharacterised protein [Bordetella pertussis]|nr:Uncharacterised protein [Bordetella pertussis]CFU46874.1 Uncharacterised protein [Bordetella pertussis]CPI83917.1 Uncharacterised protein [Bordetella pertussis]CPK38871.1 Uncharacterised protein [Bordetella pertussis]CPM62881.1 Uncharacterised protein [Bordetella pertussis]